MYTRDQPATPSYVDDGTSLGWAGRGSIHSSIHQYSVPCAAAASTPSCRPQDAGRRPRSSGRAAAARNSRIDKQRRLPLASRTGPARASLAE